MSKHRPQLLFSLMLAFSGPTYPQGATGAMSSGDKGYRLGCVAAQKPCVNSCEELWTPSQKKKQERDCEDYKRQQKAECEKKIYEEYKAEGKRCSAIREFYPSAECLNANNKALDKRLNECK